LLQFADCYSDLALFNPFDALNQDNLLGLDRGGPEGEEEDPQQPQQQQQQHQHQHQQQQQQQQQLFNQQQHFHSESAHSPLDMDSIEMDETFGIVPDDELASVNIKDLNRKLKEKGLPKEMIEKLKQRRRTLKNRKYATE
jgi:transcription initiation factor TFIID subunit TAF12